jgi:hypothetical protein
LGFLFLLWQLYSPLPLARPLYCWWAFLFLDLTISGRPKGHGYD